MWCAQGVVFFFYIEFKARPLGFKKKNDKSQGAGFYSDYVLQFSWISLL